MRWSEEQGFLRWPGFNLRKLPASVQLMPLAILGLVVTQFCDSYKESSILVSVRLDVCDPTCFSLLLPFLKPLDHSLIHLLFVHWLSKYVPGTLPSPHRVTFWWGWRRDTDNKPELCSEPKSKEISLAIQDRLGHSYTCWRENRTVPWLVSPSFLKENSIIPERMDQRWLVQSTASMYCLLFEGLTMVYYLYTK